MSGQRKGTALAILWADVPEPRRAEVEAWASARALEPPRADAGELAVARYVAVAGAPAVIEVCELRDEAAAPAAESRHAGTRTELEARGASVVVGVYGQIFPPYDERLARHRPAPALQVGRIGIPAEHDEEFNDWYNGEYLVGYMKVPGVYSARRYRNRTAGLPYLTVYELANVDVSRQPEWDRVRAQSVWRRRIERLWTHARGSPGIYRRVAADPEAST
jgi:hypothetical protein